MPLTLPFVDGFHKVVGVEQGGLESQSDHVSVLLEPNNTLTMAQEWEFIHPSFKKDQPALLKNVRRKVAEARDIHL